MTAVEWPVLAPLPAEDVVPSDVPTFSVIVPAYQAAGTIGATLASVVAQSHAPLETIVVDDGSTDGLQDVVAPFLDVVTFIQQPNRGAGAARNTAVAAATGEYVVLLDADDDWEPRRLEALAATLAARPDLDVVTTDAWFEVGGRRTGRFYEHNRFPTTDQHRVILERSYVMPHPAIRRRRIIEVGGFDSAVEPAEDWDMSIRLALSGSLFAVIDEPLATYRLRDGSLTSARARAIRARVHVLHKVERTSRDPAIAAHARRCRAEQERRAVLAEATEALLGAAPHRRQCSLAVARRNDLGAGTRLKALAGAAFPGLTGKLLHRRHPQGVTRPVPEAGGGSAT